MTNSDLVVVGRVVQRLPESYSSDTFSISESVEIEVLQTLKGDLTGLIRIPTLGLCYQSISPDDFKVGQSFVLPLSEVSRTNENLPVGMESALSLPSTGTEPIGRWFELPTCSESALAMDGEALYSSELTASGGREMDYYMHLSVLKFLLPTGLLDPNRQMLVAGIAIVLGLVIALWRRRSQRIRRLKDLESR